MRISIGIATYNRAALLARAIQSVLDQSMAEFELFICDNASSDETASVVASFKDPRIRYVRNAENLGPHGNLTLCLRQGKAPYVTLLEDDSFMLPGNLEKKVRVLDDQPDIDFVHSTVKTIVVGPDGQVLHEVFGGAIEGAEPVESGDAIVRRLLIGPYKIFHTASVMRRAVLRGMQFDKVDGPAADLGFCLRLALRSRQVAFLAEPLMADIVHPDADSIRRHHVFDGNAYRPTFDAIANHRDVLNRFLDSHAHELPEARELRRAVRRRIRGMLGWVARRKVAANPSPRSALQTFYVAARVEPTFLLTGSAARILWGSLRHP